MTKSDIHSMKLKYQLTKLIFYPVLRAYYRNLKKYSTLCVINQKKCYNFVPVKFNPHDLQN